MINYDSGTHTYWNGLDQLISVTQLLKKHGIAPDYSEVPESILEAAARKGTDIHESIHKFIVYGEDKAFYQFHLDEFIRLCKEHNIVCEDSEIVVGNDIVAGTADLFCEIGGKPAIVDYKTGQKIDLEYCRWQLSIYDYLAKAESEVFAIMHLTDKGGNLIIVEPIITEKIEELLESERNGERLNTSLPPALVADVHRAEMYLADLDRKKKSVEEEEKEVKETLLKLMEENGIKRFDNENLTITYIAPQIRTTIDSTRLKKEQPGIAEKYSKNSKVGASIRIKIKEEEQ